MLTMDMNILRIGEWHAGPVATNAKNMHDTWDKRRSRAPPIAHKPASDVKKQIDA